jgi:hypothetical protein
MRKLAMIILASMLAACGGGTGEKGADNGVPWCQNAEVCK